MTESRPLKICKVGLHGSIRALDAIPYAPGPVVCRVRLGGQILWGNDKLCASERTVLAMGVAGAVLHEFACWCAEIFLTAEWDAGRKPDSRSWAAVEAKRAWLRGEIDDLELSVAHAAAQTADVSHRATDKGFSAAASAAYWASNLSPCISAANAATTYNGAYYTASAELETRLLALLELEEK